MPGSPVSRVRAAAQLLREPDALRGRLRSELINAARRYDRIGRWFLKHTLGRMPLGELGVSDDDDRLPFLRLRDDTVFYGFPHWPAGTQEIPGPALQLAHLNLAVQVRTRYLTDERFQQREYTVQPGDTIVELGAYLGYYSMWLARQVGPTGRVCAVELIPETFQLLQRNLTENYPHTTTALHRGVWKSPGTHDALWIPRGPGGGLTAEGIERFGSTQKISVPTDTVDGILDGLEVERVDLLIVQLNGSEIEAVAGMDRAFELCRNMVIVAGERSDMDTSATLRECLEKRAFDVTVKGRAVYGKNRRAQNAPG